VQSAELKRQCIMQSMDIFVAFVDEYLTEIRAFSLPNSVRIHLHSKAEERMNLRPNVIRRVARRAVAILSVASTRGRGEGWPWWIRSRVPLHQQHHHPPHSARYARATHGAQSAPATRRRQFECRGARLTSSVSFAFTYRELLSFISIFLIATYPLKCTFLCGWRPRCDTYQRRRIRVEHSSGTLSRLDQVSLV
jgi:hypothetical protein